MDSITIVTVTSHLTLVSFQMLNVKIWSSQLHLYWVKFPACVPWFSSFWLMTKVIKLVVNYQLRTTQNTAIICYCKQIYTNIEITVLPDSLMSIYSYCTGLFSNVKTDLMNFNSLKWRNFKFQNSKLKFKILNFKWEIAASKLSQLCWNIEPVFNKIL